MRRLAGRRGGHHNFAMVDAAKLDWLERTVAVCALPERAIIEVGGDDATEWLQGQVTNQLDGLQPGDSVYAFVLTLKGRVLADVHVLGRNGSPWLDVPSEQVDALLERLDRYVIMEDVELKPRPDLCVIVAQGPLSSALSDGGWPSDRLGVGGRQWVVGKGELDAELERLTKRSRELGGGAIDESTWAAAHVVRGRPRFGIDFGESTYPQETGLTPIAVSFDKGCYIGQETVVMLQNRGKAPKTLWRWQLEGHEPPPAATVIDRAGAPVGKVTSAVEAQGTIHALGFLKRGTDEDLDGLTALGRPARPIGPADEGPGVTGDVT